MINFGSLSFDLVLCVAILSSLFIVTIIGLLIHHWSAFFRSLLSLSSLIHSVFFPFLSAFLYHQPFLIAHFYRHPFLLSTSPSISSRLPDPPPPSSPLHQQLVLSPIPLHLAKASSSPTPTLPTTHARYRHANALSCPCFLCQCSGGCLVSPPSVSWYYLAGLSRGHSLGRGKAGVTPVKFLLEVWVGEASYWPGVSSLSSLHSSLPSLFLPFLPSLQSSLPRFGNHPSSSVRFRSRQILSLYIYIFFIFYLVRC